MKRIILLGILLILSLALKSTLFETFQIFGVKPDFLLVIIVIYALFHGRQSAVKLGFFYGIIEDLLLGRFIGINAIGKMVAGYVAGWGEGSFYRNNPVAPIITFSFGILANYLVLFFVGVLSGFPGVYPFSNYFATSFMAIIYNLGIATLVFILYVNLDFKPFKKLRRRL